MVLAIDRAGIVGEDGETHQGVFDAAFLQTIPNVTIYAPSYYDELREWLRVAVYEEKGVCAVRYPRGKSLYRPKEYVFNCKAYGLYGSTNAPVVLVTYGKLFSFTAKAKERLEQAGIPCFVVKLNRIKPIDPEVYEFCCKAKSLYIFEEGIEQGGIGEHFLTQLIQRGYRGKAFLRGVKDQFVRHATMNESLHELGLDDEGMYQTIYDRKGSTQ